MILNGAKIYTLVTSGKAIGNSAPTNLAAVVGYDVDHGINSNMRPGLIGKFQEWMGAANDAVSLFAGNYNSVLEAPSGIIKTANIILNSPAVVPAVIAIDSRENK